VLEYGFNSSDVKPLFVDIHGGGWALLFPEYDEKINLRILEETGIKIISIDHPRAPQNPYPAAVEAVYEVVKYYYENAERYKIDKNSIGIGGYSSGGNLSAVTCIKANEKKEFKIKYQVLCYPGTDSSISPYDKPKCDKVLSNKDIEEFRLCYLSDPEQAKLPYVSPCLATKEQLTGLPPALLIVAGHGDPLRPEGLRYAELLKRNGVPAEIHEFPDSYHGFMSEATSDAKMAVDAVIEFIRSQT
jgi:acetyl esterase